mgnify:CR=1 FL=1
MEAISQGDSERRINVDTKEQELLLVAEMTNTMLDNMDKSIRDIYQLQLSQKDANMKALQAQINPHFMYNTMEFIQHVCSHAGSRRISRYYLRIQQSPSKQYFRGERDDHRK